MAKRKKIKRQKARIKEGRSGNQRLAFFTHPPARFLLLPFPGLPFLPFLPFESVGQAVPATSCSFFTRY
jgi:hypothetical protein